MRFSASSQGFFFPTAFSAAAIALLISNPFPSHIAPVESAASFFHNRLHVYVCLLLLELPHFLELADPMPNIDTYFIL